MAVHNAVKRVNRPLRLGCEISAEYTAAGELDIPIPIPVKLNWKNFIFYKIQHSLLMG
jgi:hypothetical protein